MSQSINKVIFDQKRAANYDEFSKVWMPNYDSFCHWLPSIFQAEKNGAVQDLLAVGCGTGKELGILAEQHHSWQITGIDPSPEMLKIAKAKLRTYTNIQLIEGLVSDLPVNKKYDAATLLLVLHFLSDDGAKLDLLKSVSERLVANAPLIIADIFGTPSELQYNLSVLKGLLYNNVSAEEITHRFDKIQHHIHYIPEERLVFLLKEAGFSTPTRIFQSTIYGGWICRNKKE
ncbi:MAG: methyltransferase domain-containing protein [Bacteroidota bacterium]